MENFKAFEPKKSNRFVINVVGTDIPQHLFKSYKMYNEGKTIIVETEFYETVEWTFNPQEFFDIEDLLIQHVNGVGDVITTLDFKVEEIEYEQVGNYADDGFLMNKLKFVTSNCDVIKNEQSSQTSEEINNQNKTKPNEVY
jgi:hypothetical protein